MRGSVHTAIMRPTLDRTLILPIPPGRWPRPTTPLNLDGIALVPKPELHITLIGRRLGTELRASFDTAFLDTAIGAALDARDWRFRRTGRQLLLRKRLDGGRFAHSLIEMIELPAMAPFHQALGRLLGRELAVPPAHVTLYVAGKAEGIGVANVGELRGYRVREVVLA